MPAASRTSRLLFASRYAAMHGAVFMTIGVYLPFWPLWLSSRGLSAEEIGLLLALGTWVKVISNPVIAQAADRTGRAKATLVGCAIMALMIFSAFFLTEGFWAILTVLVLVNIFHPALIPLTESQTLAAAGAGRLDYGRVRLCGSLTFMLGTLGGGWLLSGRDPDLILPLILATLALSVLAALLLPGAPPAARPGALRGLWALLIERRFLLFLAVSTAFAASHAVYYGFSALHWRAAGLSETTIGWLWAEGVIAEVLLFAFGAPLVRRLGPAGLFLVAAGGGLVRWSLLGFSSELPVLLGVQWLHAATFGAAHLGAMHFMARHAPEGLRASAQALYSAVPGGLGIGFAILLSGWLYETLGGGAFHVMAALSVLGGLLTLALLRETGRAQPHSGQGME